MKTKALIYCRVSSQRQVMEGHGNSSQEQRCRVRAKEKGYPVEAVFPDDGVSGGLFDRPAMKRLIDYLDNHPTEEYVIIFDDLARFARDLEVHLKLRKDLIGRGAKLECLNFNIEDEEWTIPLIKAKHEGLISIDTYNTVQERLKRRTKPWKRRDYSLDFPLRPHVLCNACGKPLTGSWNRGRSKRYPNYFCRIKGCIYDWKVTRNNVVEEKFEALLFQVKPANEIIDLTKDVLTEQWGIRVASYSHLRTSVKRGLGEG